MSVGSTLARAGTIASVDYRRLARRLRARPGLLALLSIFVVPLSVLAPLALVAVGGYAAGSAVRTGEVANPVAAARPLVALSGLYLLTVGTIAGIGRYGRLERPAIELPAVPLRTLVLGRLFAAALALIAVGGLPLALAIGAYALGARTLATPLSMGIAAALLVAFGSVVGYALGLAGASLAGRLESTRLRVAVAALVGGGYVFAMLSGSTAELVDPLVETVARSPVGWGTDLALLGTATASPARALGFVALVTTAVLASSAALPALAVARWIE